MRLHGLSAFAKERLVAFASDQGEVLTAPGLLEDDLGEFFFRIGEFPAGGNPLGFKKALLDEFGPTRLDGEIRLGEGDFLLSGVAILRDEVAGVTGEHEVFNDFFRVFGHLDRCVTSTK
jgi:hypothetical protein